MVTNKEITEELEAGEKTETSWHETIVALLLEIRDKVDSIDQKLSS